MNKSKPTYIFLFMVGISLFFGAGLATVNYVTKHTLAKNERFFKNKILCRAFLLETEGQSPEAYQNAVGRALNVGSLTDGKRVLETYSTIPPLDSRIGFLFSGSGFWGPITGIAVLTDDLKKVTNIQFLEHQETPGLGARIEDPWFTNQFKGLEIAWEAPVERRIIIGPSPPDAKNRVDAITGATQTSMALMRSLNSELELFRKASMKRGKNLSG